jgi:hypothetical protein
MGEDRAEPHNAGGFVFASFRSDRPDERFFRLLIAALLAVRIAPPRRRKLKCGDIFNDHEATAIKLRTVKEICFGVRRGGLRR